eukprot:TRINITY_DN7201_c0_g1_i3.p1 TRINITY_DN7201_c0_g1~~TRINITY_DN7201_c0_g1_i3.p1  ORF type:complete len:110 (-),score=24.03 TRINITY_DN7201_c0_g1_i3:4-333(-)
MSHTLNADQVTEFSQIFKTFDKNGDGSIDAKELGHVFQALGVDVSAEELSSLIAHVDKDKSGNIELVEFLVLMDEKVNSKVKAASEKQFRSAFKAVSYTHLTLPTTPYV